MWGVENIQLHGNTEEPEVWKKLDQLRERLYKHESGADIGITAMAIDIKGHRTKVVKDYVYKRRFNNVFAFQGVGSAAKQMISRSKQQIEEKNARRLDVWSIRVDDLKRQVQGYLNRSDPDDFGYAHFPMLQNGQDVAGYDQEFFEQLCSEKQERKKTRGFERVEFVKTRVRNEAFDKRVYWRALVQILNPDWDAFRQKVAKTEQTPQPRKSGLFRTRTHQSSDPYL
jgi:phage terminase large subunit GpA-like protein